MRSEKALSNRGGPEAGRLQVTVPGLDRLLHDYPEMSLRPVGADGVTCVKGLLSFKANQDIEDAFELEIRIPAAFPREAPVVHEIGGRIPKHPDFHVNGDDSLCLGSPLRLKKTLADHPDIVRFAEQCLVPFLYNVSIKLRCGGSFPTGELAHGLPGIIEDYMDLMGLSRPGQVVAAIRALAVRKRIANKRPCPCGCGGRLGRCSFHQTLNELRHLAPRAWFAKHLAFMKETASRGPTT